MGQKSKFNFLRNFGWKLLVLSLFISGVVSYLMQDMFLPYRLEILESLPNELDYSVRYHDFDHDGFSEKLELKNYSPTKYYIHIKNRDGGIIDQTNYWELADINSLFFKDITGDGFEEIFAFTQLSDSIYLYIHDIVKKRVIINRLFITKIEEPKSPYQHERYASFYPVCMTDTSIDKSGIFIFAARTFAALAPRTVFAVDLNNQKVINKFITKSTIYGAYPYDLTGDGIDEIIVYSGATGNVHYQTQYSDDRCWLFVLDQNLNPIFPPLSFSEYPSFFTCLPIEVHSERYLFAMSDYMGEKNLDRSIYLINSKGKIHLRTKNPFRDSFEQCPVVSSKNPSEIFGWYGNNEIIKLNHRLEIVKRVDTPFEKPRTAGIKDLNSDGSEEILFISDDYLLIYNQELNLLAKFPIIQRGIALHYIETGLKNPPEIYARVKDICYRLRLSKNKLQTIFPLLFFGLTGITFLLLTSTHKISTIIIRHLRFFKYLRFDTSDGILFIDNKGKIIYSNSRVAQIFNLHYPLIKGKEVVSILNHYPQIAEIIKKSMTIGERVDKKIMLSEENSGLENEISIQPYKYILRKGFNYLLIIRSSGTSSHSDKIHTWSRAVQKMAHDIKTPLSTVSLNLKVLQNRLEKIQLSETEHDELSDDIKMMRTELDNIQSMTKNFLKFSNLDKPHLQAFNINSIINTAKEKFQSYLNDDLSIEITIDKDVKPVWADPQQMEMVFNILLENSLAAMKGNGLISINVSSVQYLDKIFSESVEIEVADTGPGIKKEDTHRIFEPYYSTKPEGTGMGLAIAKKIIEDNGGTIEVHSKPDFGAVFLFSIPVLQE
jgi:nitrogen-specific signal transduction histidine kinase